MSELLLKIEKPKKSSGNDLAMKSVLIVPDARRVRWQLEVDPLEI
jgi:hypothetical protein